MCCGVWARPEFEVDVVREVHGELLDEGEEDWLGERAGRLVKDLLLSHLLTEVEHQGEVRGREGRLKGPVDLLGLEQLLDLLLQNTHRILNTNRCEPQKSVGEELNQITWHRVSAIAQWLLVSEGVLEVRLV